MFWLWVGLWGWSAKGAVTIALIGAVLPVITVLNKQGPTRVACHRHPQKPQAKRYSVQSCLCPELLESCRSFVSCVCRTCSDPFCSPPGAWADDRLSRPEKAPFFCVGRGQRPSSSVKIPIDLTYERKPEHTKHSEEMPTLAEPSQGLLLDSWLPLQLLPQPYSRLS